MTEAYPFVDLHCHVLAGLDDGPCDLDQSVGLCRLLAKEGVEIVAATCHQRGAFFGNDADAVRVATSRLAGALEAEQVPIRVVPSAEWMLDAESFERWREVRSELLTIADNGRYALVEFPFQIPSYVTLVPQLFAESGIIPVLAHAENYPQLASNPERVQRLSQLGYIIQVNADSVAGRLGKRASGACRRLIQLGHVDLVASDAHSMDQRPPALRQAFEAVQGWTNPRTTRLLFRDNPLAILEGRDISRAQPLNWLSRWIQR